jgi:Domain of unknown function (DUF4261)
MDLTDRFFGKGIPQLGGPPVANAHLVDPPTFALLFTEPLDLDADALTIALREYHTELAAATAELLTVPSVMGLVAWGRHVVKLVGFGNPMEASAVRACLQVSHFDPLIKEEAYRHTSHVLLFYAGYERDPLEQYVALAAVSAALARFGALVVVNELARTAVPVMVLQPHEEDNGDTLGALRGLPLPFLYVGFVMIELEDEPGLWMRTYGCQAFKLPDLAFHAASDRQISATFSLFANVLEYLRESGKAFTPGDTMNVGEGMFLRLRARTTDEWFLESPGEMLVAEAIQAEEMNT